MLLVLYLRLNTGPGAFTLHYVGPIWRARPPNSDRVCCGTHIAENLKKVVESCWTSLPSGRSSNASVAKQTCPKKSWQAKSTATPRAKAISHGWNAAKSPIHKRKQSNTSAKRSKSPQRRWTPSANPAQVRPNSKTSPASAAKPSKTSRHGSTSTVRSSAPIQTCANSSP